ncbi:recombination mediator RecR [Aquirufa antheringensis]|jgi:recombination protein RecR|uniref:Recombination protein RecR n=1 Tax=Aquirufa antheringensis TaxID=2516559 RepID=A0A4V2IVI1_9BACT|nr:recombination mediator RecR [Aquirufa antheringensis]MCZ2485806.1 recombination protein RecR [Aquirufa antheringensis]MCZ2486502.1 recombination protein RecR [Aquirufa antheringensis]MCZ2488717.1 recombination protein RecR [Aquirufa antheringensis]TBH71212.1 recombination protein RecR [Aquirufa antheringensis]USQ04308.1 recombination protein RecR [Aquirufa antheringensis]
MNNYPSKMIEQAVEEISKLPGIGKKSALRLALHLLKRPEAQSLQLAHAVVQLRTETKYCPQCHMISDGDLCGICASHKRDESIICVVEDLRDVLAIENTGQFMGLYHVLGGIISPLSGISPGDLTIESLVARVASGKVSEVILGLSPTMEGDTTAFYLTKKLKEFPIKLSTIARGIPIGGDLEYTDEITLGRSIVGRVVYE